MEYLTAALILFALVMLFNDLAFGLQTILIKLGFLEDNTARTDLDSKYINEIAAVVKTIPAQMQGKIIFNGVEWLAKDTKGQEIKEGEKVKIVNREGTIMVVTNEIT